MDYVLIGKIVNTHGIKGELRLLSDFDKKDIVFKSNFNIYIGPGYIKETISSYRHHKMFDMITLQGYNNINEVLKYKYMDVYVKRSDLNLNENDYLLDDLIGMSVIDDNEVIGKGIDYNQGANVLLKVSGTKEFYIPLVDEYVINVDTKNREIHTKNGKDLIL